jgi:hypothetical protein
MVYVELTKEQKLELQKMRKNTGYSMQAICEMMHCSASKIKALEYAKTKVDSDFLEKIIKKYKSILKYRTN